MLILCEFHSSREASDVLFRFVMSSPTREMFRRIKARSTKKAISDTTSEFSRGALFTRSVPRLLLIFVERHGPGGSGLRRASVGRTGAPYFTPVASQRAHAVIGANMKYKSNNRFAQKHFISWNLVREIYLTSWWTLMVSFHWMAWC